MVGWRWDGGSEIEVGWKWLDGGGDGGNGGGVHAAMMGWTLWVFGDGQEPS